MLEIAAVWLRPVNITKRVLLRLMLLGERRHVCLNFAGCRRPVHGNIRQRKWPPGSHLKFVTSPEWAAALTWDVSGDRDAAKDSDFQKVLELERYGKV